ncbi:DNA ligase [Paenibacillus sp. UMB4589-SE434]|uniref:ATP-dependent DNA ligase n=1 Tax=Paenibacillus sp. UMB4589-SE434 TaxID=3046314 RepID=UPI00254E5B77|nr:DNA ligase [Paenibacillus sp. UMB4589-SE434]MDK8182052.1 DNA ligase [Paenibacillus sp. UMB4589-SE434]
MSKVRQPDQLLPLGIHLDQRFMPMAPLPIQSLPAGEDWLHQLKWDGIRLLAFIHEGQIELYTRKMEKRTADYQPIAAALATYLPLEGHSVLLDGEAVVFDPELQRPSFSLILKRQRSANSTRQQYSLTYVVFDLLALNGKDMRQLPYEQRHQTLLELMPERTASLFVTDVFSNGPALWQWVEANEWEGIVSKHRNSPYLQGKLHREWVKLKKRLNLTALAVGYVINSGRIASLILLHTDGVYIGRAASGLNETHRTLLQEWSQQYGVNKPVVGRINSFPAELNREQLQWFTQPLLCDVTALELTSAGVLRHPKLLALPSKQHLQN